MPFFRAVVVRLKPWPAHLIFCGSEERVGALFRPLLTPGGLLGFEIHDLDVPVGSRHRSPCVVCPPRLSP